MLEILNPATEEVVESLEPATEDDADAVIARARDAFPAWRDVQPGDRSRLLRRLADALDAEQENLAQLESKNTGKPIGDSRGEMAMVAETFHYYAGMPERLLGDTIPVSGGVDVTFREPLGVVGLIVPWNFPLNIASWKLGPALACGNTVVLKPAELTPLSALRLAELALEAGIPEGVLNVVVGKSANVIFADADLETAAAAAPYAVFDNAGQDCCARSRILVERSAYDRFADLLIEATRNVKVGDPNAE